MMTGKYDQVSLRKMEKFLCFCSQRPEKKSKKLNTKEKVGIAIGVGGFVIIVGAIVYVFSTKRRSKSKVTDENPV